MPKILSWNIRHGGGDRVDRIIDCLSQPEADADVVVLTEFRNNAHGDRLRHAVEARGLVYQHPGCASVKTNTVLLAARCPFRATFPTNSLSGYEHCCIGASFSNFQLLAFYFPQADLKGPLFDWLLAQPHLGGPTLLIGDFNTGIHRIDEQHATFVHADKFAALQAQGWVDVWRSRNLDIREFSWFSSHGNGFRLDHAFASPELDARVRSVSYSHRERESGASDHSMLFLEFEEAAQQAAAADGRGRWRAVALAGRRRVRGRTAAGVRSVLGWGARGRS